MFLGGLKMNQELLSAMDNLDLSVSIAQKEILHTVFPFNSNKGKNRPGPIVKWSILREGGVVRSQYQSIQWHAQSGYIVNNWLYWHTVTHKVLIEGKQFPILSRRGRFFTSSFVLSSTVHCYSHWLLSAAANILRQYNKLQVCNPRLHTWNAVWEEQKRATNTHHRWL